MLAEELKFEVQTPDFAGPMDLLVFLVRRRELDVEYISVSAIARDYFDWLTRIELENLDAAGDFILLAATLLQFKAVNLLPGSEPEISDAELEPSQREFSEAEVLALRETASKLAELEENQINLFDRGSVTLEGLDDEVTNDMLADVSVFDIALAFRDLIYKLPDEPTHVVEQYRFTLEGQIAFIRSFVNNRNRVRFQELADALYSRLAVIMTFLAMLELMRLGQMRVVQTAPYESLWLVRNYNLPVEEN